MEYDMKKLKKNVDQKKDELNLAIENNESKEAIYRKSIAADDAIAEYIKAETLYDKCKKQVEKYNEIWDKPYKNEVIEMIKEDVKDKIGYMRPNELQHFCDNVYILTCLKVHNIEEQEIMSLLLCRNNLFLYENSINPQESEYNPKELSFYTYLKDKYIKVIKSKN